MRRRRSSPSIPQWKRGQPLIVANITRLEPLSLSVRLGYDALEEFTPEVSASLRHSAGLAASLGVHVERLRIRSPRPITALLELAAERTTRAAGLRPRPAARWGRAVTHARSIASARRARVSSGSRRPNRGLTMGADGGASVCALRTQAAWESCGAEPLPRVFPIRLGSNVSSVMLATVPAEAMTVTFLIDCPNCGKREALEFSYGGETTSRATDSLDRAGVHRLPVLPPERERVADGMVAAPRRMPHVVPRRAAHVHQRGPGDVAPGQDRGSHDPAAVIPGVAGSRARPEPWHEHACPGATGNRSTATGASGSRWTANASAAFEGDTIGSALAAAGVDITGRSFKYHRPRGLFCMTGSCPNCLMQVDGIPNVRACTEPVRDGMQVQRQNAWPSADRDIHGWLNKVSFMMPPGFYYKIFQHPTVGLAAGGAVHPVQGGARQGPARGGSRAARADHAASRRRW